MDIKEISCEIQHINFTITVKTYAFSWSDRKTTKPRLSNSPLLEVNRTGSLLIVKSNSSNPSSDTQEQAPAQRLPGGSKSTRTHTLNRLCLRFQAPLAPFLPGRPLRRSSFPFKLFPPDLSTPPPSFLLFLLPSSSSKVSLSHSLSLSPTK